MEELKVLSIDAESNGIWGEIFCISAVEYDENGKEVSRFVGRCPLENPIPWVKDNVIPVLTDIEVDHASYEELLKSFIEYALPRYKHIPVLVHMGHIIESRIFADAYKLNIIGYWDAPYLWYDVCNICEDSTRGYCEKNNIEIHGDMHHPTYDCIEAYAVWTHHCNKNA